MFNSLTLDIKKKFTSWRTPRISTKKIKPFDLRLAAKMVNLENNRIILKLSNSVLVQQNYSSLHSNFILHLYIASVLNNWPCNPRNDFAIKDCLLGIVKLTTNAIKSKFIFNGPGITFNGAKFMELW